MEDVNETVTPKLWLYARGGGGMWWNKECFDNSAMVRCFFWFFTTENLATKEAENLAFFTEGHRTTKGTKGMASDIMAILHYVQVLFFC